MTKCKILVEKDEFDPDSPVLSPGEPFVVLIEPSDSSKLERRRVKHDAYLIQKYIEENMPDYVVLVEEQQDQGLCLSVVPVSSDYEKAIYLFENMITRGDDERQRRAEWLQQRKQQRQQRRQRRKRIDRDFGGKRAS